VNKRTCPFIEKKKWQGQIVGKLCGQVLLNDEEYCPDHINKLSNLNLVLCPNTCQFIISQTQGKNRIRARKGLPCGNLCDSGNVRCRIHLKAENNVINKSDIIGTLFLRDENKKIIEMPILKTQKQIKTVIRSFKIRCYPTKNQVKLLNKMFGCCRKTWNLMIPQQHILKGKKLEELRSMFVTNKNLPVEYQYLSETPKASRDTVIDEFLHSIKNIEESYKRKQKNKKEYKAYCLDRKIKFRDKPIIKPILHFRKKRDTQTLSVDKNSTTIYRNNIAIYNRFFNRPIKLQGRIKKDKKYNRLIEHGLKHDIKILKTKTNKFYFIIPYDEKIRDDPKEKIFVSLDPGVRAPITTYDIDGNSIAYGEGADIKIRKTHHYIAILKRKIKELRKTGNLSLIHKLNNKKLAHEEKLKNKIINLHHHIIKELIAYKYIYMPKFNIKQIEQTKTTYKCTKREMNALAPYKLKQRLIDKAEVVNCMVSTSNEFRTTMTCGVCLRKNRHVHDSRVFKCPYCNYTCGRDCNAARNNVLKYLINVAPIN